MTIQNEVYREDYNGNDSTTSFPVSFYFFDDTHLKVVLVAADDSETVQVLNTDYTVVGAGNPAGGSVEMVVPPATGERLVIVRDVPITQLLDYVENDNFPAESHEGGLDKLTMIVQQQQEELDRTIQVSEGVTAVISLPAPDAGKGLKWNATGDNLENSINDLDTQQAAAQASADAAAISESNAANSASAASGSATSAAGSASNASTSETNAAASEDKAQKWAEENEDVEVDPGQYSAKHWAAKAEQSSQLPTFVDAANGNPTITDTSFDIDANIGTLTWESIGPPLAGADHDWLALGTVPPGTDWIEVRIEVAGLDNAVVADLYEHRLHARQTGGAQSASGANLVSHIRSYGSSASGISAAAAGVTTVKIPLDTLGRFDMIESISGFRQFSTVIDARMYLVGYGNNP